MPDYVLYDVEVGVCSPLHIGSGETLLQGYDFVTHAGRTWRLNLEALLLEKAEDPAIARQLAAVPPGSLLSATDMRQGSPLFRYVIPGVPRSSETNAQVLEQIKDVWDRPYLPGSSLKGALRTALLWYALKTQGRQVDLAQLDRSPKRAAGPLERAVLGADPNHDLLRALHVADSEPVGPGKLMLVNAKVVGGETPGSPIELEAIQAGVVVHTQLKVDRALFSRWARQGGLDLGAGEAWLGDLPAIVAQFSEERLRQGLAWCGTLASRSLVAGFYRDQRAGQGGNVCHLQVGWGGGWDSKTIGLLLQERPSSLEEVIRFYRLHRGRPRRPGQRFPGTRRMAMRRQSGPAGQAAEAIVAPLGWVRLAFRRRS